MPDKQRSAENFGPLASKPQKQQRPSYFTTRGGSSDSTTSSLPVTPQIFHSIVPKPTSGYESDSSEEGRKPTTNPVLGLRVINPDEQDNVIDSGKIQQSPVLPSSLDGSPNETERKIYHDGPELPSNQSVIYPATQSNSHLARRESKTASEPKEV